MDYPYLLLDAGGTLIFPDQDLIAAVAAAEGSVIEPERVFEAHFRLLYQFDRLHRDGAGLDAFSIWELFREMLVFAGVDPDAAVRAVAKLRVRHEEVSLWTYTKPWIVETLAALARMGVRMSVISNSDGRVFQQLEACGVTPYLESVFDSGLVGIEKPDPRLFAHALEALHLAPGDAVYVGDFYCVDVVGANRAGIGAVHLDPLGNYGGWPGTHVRDLRDLPGWFEAFAAHPASFDLFPVRE